MLQIRLSKGASSEATGGTKSLPAESITVACPDHLVLADLPLAKSLGSVAATSRVKIVGRRSRRSLGERVHFCVRCDYPISIYGRLSPCEHAFCLDCARSDSTCYLCDERIQKIQTIKMMEGIYICAAPLCLKSFLKRNDFEAHIHQDHHDLLHPEGQENEASGPKHSDSAARTPVFSPGSNSHAQDRDDQPHPQPSPRQIQSENGTRAAPDININYGHGSTRMNFPHPMGPNFPFGYFPDGMQPFYGAPYEMPRHEPTPEGGAEHSSVLGFPPGQRPWASAPSALPPENAYMESYRVGMFQGEYGFGNGGDVRDGKGILASQPSPLPPPPPPLLHPQLSQSAPGRFHHGNLVEEGRNFGWRND